MDRDLKLDELIEACGYGLLERAKRLIDDGVNVNGYRDNLTPLIASIYGQNIELTEFLIKSGAIINQGKHTSLHEAFDCMLMNMVDEGLEEPDLDELNIIELLINEGGDLGKINDIGISPLGFLNKHASNKETFEKMKDFFRSFIPDIDKKIEYKTKHNKK